MIETWIFTEQWYVFTLIQGRDQKKESAEHCSNVQERKQTEDPNFSKHQSKAQTLKQLVGKEMLLYK